MLVYSGYINLCCLFMKLGQIVRSLLIKAETDFSDFLTLVSALCIL